MDNLETCPHCQGKCCRNLDLGYRVEHFGAEVFRHDCDYCQDGTIPSHKPSDYDRGRKDELLKTLEWMKKITSEEENAMKHHELMLQVRQSKQNREFHRLSADSCRTVWQKYNTILNYLDFQLRTFGQESK